MSKKGRKKSRPDIPKQLKSSLTTTMRAELGAETFDNQNGQPRTARGSPTDALLPASPTLSECSTQRSEPVLRARLQPALDETIHYLNDIVSVYEGTCGTVSFESLVPAGTELLEAEELPEEESKVHQLKMVPLRKIPVKMAEEVDEKEFILGTTVGGKLLPGVVEQTRWARGEAEMNYLQELVNDVNALVALSGRVDVLVQHSIQFEKNHLPILKMTLQKKPSCDNTPRERQQEILEALKREERELHRPSMQNTNQSPLGTAGVLEVINAGFDVANSLPS